MNGIAHFNGSEYLSTGGAAVTQGEMLRLTSGVAGGGAVSYALYSFPLGSAAPAQLLVDAYMNLAPADAGATYWIGVADYGASRWKWLGTFADSPLVLSLPASDSGGSIKSPADNLVVCVLAYNGASLYLAGLEANPTILEVGPDMPYARIEDAYAATTGLATILVWPQAGNAPYTQPALQIDKPELSFRAVIVDGARVKLDGTGFNYTGAGSVPRAMFQFNSGADLGSVAGFEMYNATNDSFNGAGVRINQANTITVRNCEIRNNDMGIMSNGSLALSNAVDQLIEFCVIHHNGSLLDPGYNHNLYLGGVSVMLRACEIYSSLTGHNVKSRARRTYVEFCYVHDSANREFDLVDDAENTAQLGSDAVLLGNVIVKDPLIEGNRAVIHFGQDGGNDHNGNLWLVHNTIVTPFISPVVTLSAASAGARIYNNIVWDNASRQNGQVLVAVNGGALLGSATVGYNWLAHGQSLDPAAVDAGGNYSAASGENPPFADPSNADPALRDFSLTSAGVGIVDATSSWRSLGLPIPPRMEDLFNLFEYQLHPSLRLRPDDGLPDKGAYEYVP